ncbi:STM3941 family protein [Xylophilus sp. GW821-FHT01B05]
MTSATLAIDTHAIPRSRAKAVLLLLAAGVLVLLAIWLVTCDAAWLAAQTHFESLTSLRVLSGLALLGAIACAVLGQRRWADRSPGLVLDAEGVVDHISSAQAGRIPWADITGLAVLKVRHQFTLVLQVTDPQKYLAATPAVRRTLADADLRLCGSPVAIAAGTLGIAFGDLVELCHRYHERYGVKR